MSEINARKRGSKWEYYFEIARINNKRKRISKGGFLSKSEAVKAGIKAMSEYELSGLNIVPSEISVNDYLNHWIELYCIPNLKTATVTNYRKRIKYHILPAIGKYRLTSIKPEHIQNLINNMISKGYSKNTVATIKGILSSSFRYAVNPLNYIQSSPTDLVVIPKGSRKKYKQTQHIRNTISKSDIERIFERFPKGTSTYLPLLFAYRCGMRLGEAYAVTWDNIDFEEKTITINKQLQWDEELKYWYLTSPKYNSIRTVDIDDFIVNLLIELKAKQNRAKEYYSERYIILHSNEKEGINYRWGEEIDFVNVRENGDFIQPRTMQHTSSIIHKFCPDFDFHSLRHTHCTMLLEAGLPLKYVQERLGHKNINVTLNIYNHLTENQAEQGKKLLNQVF